MSNQKPDVLTQLSRQQEQAEASAEGTARMVAIYYKTLIAEGLSEEYAKAQALELLRLIMLKAQQGGGQ